MPHPLHREQRSPQLWDQHQNHSVHLHPPTDTHTAPPAFPPVPIRPLFSLQTPRSSPTPPSPKPNLSSQPATASAYHQQLAASPFCASEGTAIPPVAPTCLMSTTCVTAGVNSSHNLPHHSPGRRGCTELCYGRCSGTAAWMGAAATPCCCCVHGAMSAARQQCWGCYLLVDVAHGEVLLCTGAGCTDVLQPGPSSALVGIDAEFLVSQVVSNLWEAMQRSLVMEW